MMDNSSISNTEMDSIFNLMQNEAISAIALHSFTLGYHQLAKNKEEKKDYPSLAYMFYVLPIVYNYSSMTTFLSSQAVYTALHKEPSIRLGLHDRALKMMGQTFDGLNIAFSKKILSFNYDDSTIVLLKPYTSKKLIITMDANRTYNSVKQIQDCAFKLGSIFAKINEKNIQLDLNIMF